MKVIGYRRLESFHCWKCRPGRMIGILGSGHLQTFLPLWLQKSEGHGLRTEAAVIGSIQAPGIGIGGLPASSSSAKSFRTLPLVWRLFHGTSQQAGQSPQTGFNLGMVWDLSDLQHIMFSAGPAFGGPNQLQGYFAYQLTFGPNP